MRCYFVRAFSRTPGGGNPAGVVLDADELQVKEMQSIAKDLGYSETAFVLNSQNGLAKVRYFTPKQEVGLCGHATIAAIGLLKKIGRVENGTYHIETEAGLLEVVIDGESVLLELGKPLFFEEVDPSEIADSLGVHEDMIVGDPLPQIVSTGLKDLLIGVYSMDVLYGIEPDYYKIQEISNRYKIAGYHVFHRNERGVVHSRNFAPLLGINEESATGTANGALAAYLYRNGFFQESDLLTETFYQGINMGQPSEIEVRVVPTKGSFKVYVGGTITDITIL